MFVNTTQAEKVPRQIVFAHPNESPSILPTSAAGACVREGTDKAYELFTAQDSRQKKGL